MTYVLFYPGMELYTAFGGNEVEAIYWSIGMEDGLEVEGGEGGFKKSRKVQTFAGKPARGLGNTKREKLNHRPDSQGTKKLTIFLGRTGLGSLTILFFFLGLCLFLALTGTSTWGSSSPFPPCSPSCIPLPPHQPLGVPLRRPKGGLEGYYD
ncbi:hypothetical protein F4818DRAFT_241048 [Hypoxylon cercidicola]|nr:hypothetical protein F4818DRAFT_241048 [Hypoxylon cercidicola]